ncbi:MAG: hypothetical protein A2Z31_00240 [candidate division NC10 bacterium RBG_16_65_8]|nr:MAG: hypothetical protein A2Z31_00240 [candidate division NC10 bacterium RBG_16_65_8]
MEYLPLPWLSRRLDRPIYAAIKPFLDDGQRPGIVPASGAGLLLTRWPSARFMAQMPAAVPGGPCYDTDLDARGRRDTNAAWEGWVDVFLSHVLSRPLLRPEQVHVLGPDRDRLALGLLRAWCWVPEEDGTFARLPSAAFQDALRLLGAKTRRLPSELLSLPFPAFILDFRILMNKQRVEPLEGVLSPEMIEA